MKYAIAVNNTDMQSDKYLKLNNCGYFPPTSEKMRVCRTRGRLDYQLIYIKQGNMIFEQNGTKKILNSGTVCLYRPAEKQIYASVDEKTEFYWIHFTGYAIEELFCFFKSSYYELGNFEAFSNTCQDIMDSYQMRRPYYELQCEGEFLMLIAALAQKIRMLRGTNNQKITQILEFISENYTQNLSNEEYAGRCGISKFHFIKLFKDHTGTTPQQYRITLRITRAKQMLAETKLRVKEIADMVGFDDSLYFSKVFKRSTGYTPTQYREIHRTF